VEFREIESIVIYNIEYQKGKEAFYLTTPVIPQTIKWKLKIFPHQAQLIYKKTFSKFRQITKSL
jgi:hypothetical protein